MATPAPRGAAGGTTVIYGGCDEAGVSRPRSLWAYLCPGRSAARGDALQTWDLQNNSVAVPDQQRTASGRVERARGRSGALHCIRDTNLTSRRERRPHR